YRSRSSRPRARWVRRSLAASTSRASCSCTWRRSSPISGPFRSANYSVTEWGFRPATATTMRTSSDWSSQTIWPTATRRSTRRPPWHHMERRRDPAGGVAPRWRPDLFRRRGGDLYPPGGHRPVEETVADRAAAGIGDSYDFLSGSQPDRQGGRVYVVSGAMPS